MSLFKRGNVWWCYVYRDGIRHQYSTGTANRRKAETIEDKLKEELNNRRFDIVQADPQMPFDDVAASFVASGSVRPHHLYHLKFLLPFFSGTVVLRITKSLAEEFRRERHRRNPSIKEATVNRDLSVLRHILYWASMNNSSRPIRSPGSKWPARGAPADRFSASTRSNRSSTPRRATCP